MEQYKKIKEFPNYGVSVLGEIKNLKTDKILKQRNDKYGYKRINLYVNSKMKVIHVHKLVANAYLEKIENKNLIDHIDNNKANNCLENLRFCNASENTRNSKLSSKNTSGIRGVSLHKKTNKYVARIYYDNKHKHIGYFDSLEEAKIARQTKSREIYGEFQNACER